VCLPLLISLCTIKSRSSLLAPAHPGGPGKRAVKRLWWWYFPSYSRAGSWTRNYFHVTAVFQVNLGQKVPLWILLLFRLFWKRTLGLVQQDILWARCRLSPNNQCQSTEGNTKHGPQPVAWTHPFFIHHRTPDGMGVDPIVPALRRQYWDPQDQTFGLQQFFYTLNALPFAQQTLSKH